MKQKKRERESERERMVSLAMAGAFSSVLLRDLNETIVV